MSRGACDCLDLCAAMEPQRGKESASAVGSLRAGAWFMPWAWGGCRDEQGCGCLASGGLEAAGGVNVSGLDFSPKWSLF